MYNNFFHNRDLKTVSVNANSDTEYLNEKWNMYKEGQGLQR